MNLETKTSYVCAVYRPKEEDYDLAKRVSSLRAWLEKNAETFAYIVHDLDLDGQGQRMTSHIHVVYKAHECKRLGTFLNELSQALEVDTLTISIEKASSVKSCIRYLIHKDDPQKHQYALGLILHNWPEREFAENFADKAKHEIDFDFLLDLIRRSNTITEVIAVIGIGSYRYWRPVIADIWNDYHKR